LPQVLLNPIPEARSLSTGTVYISSGLLSLIDNEAQLAYILGHEIAHVEKDHWHDDALVARGIDRYNQKQEKKRGCGRSSPPGQRLALPAGRTGSLAVPHNMVCWRGSEPLRSSNSSSHATVSWDKQQEDEADQLGLKYMFERNYDAARGAEILCVTATGLTREHASAWGLSATRSGSMSGRSRSIRR